MKSRRKSSRTRAILQQISVAIIAFGVLGCDQAPAKSPDPAALENRKPKVLLIGIDGVRPDVLAEVSTPNIDALKKKGAFTDQTRTTVPSVSGPSWSSMLTGVWPDKHGVIDNQFDGRRYDKYPDFLSRIEFLKPEMSTFAAVDWLPLMQIGGEASTISPAVDVRISIDGYVTGWAEGDLEVTSAAVSHLNEADPDALFVYLGNPDETSHQHNSIGAEYREAIALSDYHVGLLVDAIQARKTFHEENWLILISTDHGRRADGGHGGLSDIEMTTFILASGPAVQIGNVDQDTFIVDVAVTALTHLGITPDPAWELDGRAVGLR